MAFGVGYCFQCRTMQSSTHSLRNPGHRIKMPPSPQSLSRQADRLGLVSCPDGCKTEADSQCPHGHDSWMTLLFF